MQKQYPYFTPYQFAGNQPIWASDLDGLEPKYRTGVNYLGYEAVFDDKIGDYRGLLYGYSIEYEKKFYVIFESVHGNWQWYREYDKDGWKGSPTEFQWYNPAEDKSAYWLVAPIVGIPALAVYGKAFFIWLGKEVLEEMAGVPIPDNPIDFWKRKLKKKAEKKLAEEMAKKRKKSSSEYEGMEFLDDNARMFEQPWQGISPPAGWIKKESKKGGGTVFQDPLNPHNSIRQMPGNHNSPNMAQGRPDVIFKKNGIAYDANGNASRNASDPAAHIPLDQFDINKMPKFD